MIETGTAIVILLLRGAIWVAADSRVVSINSTVTVPPSAACKIHRFGGVYYAQAGFYSQTDSDFRPVEIAESVAGRTSTLSEAAREFESAISPSLRAAVERLRSTNLSYYLMKVEGRNPILAADFFGFESGSARVAGRKFFVKERPNAEITLTAETVWIDCLSDCPSGGSMMAYLGASFELDSFARRHPVPLKQLDIRARLQKLIEVAAAANPEAVGLPVDILRIDQKGGTWVQRKPSCPS